MNKKGILYVTFLLLFTLTGNLYSQTHTTRKDTIFVKEKGKEGLYVEETGTVEKITLKYLILVTKDGERKLFTRDVVKIVKLDKTHSQQELNLVTMHWNEEQSKLVKAVQGFPIVGESLTFLNELPGATDTLVAIIILLAMLSYAAYKVYEALVISADIRKLNTNKVHMELSKIYFEVAALKKQLGLNFDVTDIEPEISELKQRDIETVFRMPEIHVLEFLKFKILGLLTSEEKKKRSEVWLKKWQNFKMKNNRLPAIIYYPKSLIYFLAVSFVALFCLGSIVNIFLPFINPDISGGVSPGISLIYIVFFILSLSFLVRLNNRRKILKNSYSKFKTENN